MKRHGSSQAQRAAMLGANPRFQLYLDARKRHRHGLTLEQLPDGTHNEEDAADFIRQCCGVESRADIDRDIHAESILRRIVADYSAWERRQARGQ